MFPIDDDVKFDIVLVKTVTFGKTLRQNEAK